MDWGNEVGLLSSIKASEMNDYTFRGRPTS